MKPSFKHLLILALFSMIGLGAAEYAYTGPNRTRTEPVITCKIVLWECQKIESKDRYSYHKIDDWSCSNEGKPWKAYPSSGPACESETTGKKYWSREERVEEIPVTYPPAEISAQPLCSLPGQNGWCRAGAILQLSGYEPVAAVAHQNPDFVYNNIKPNLDGSYSVTLYGDKNPRNPDNSFTYIVNADKFHSDDRKMARPGDANGFLQENWVRIYESAYLNSKGGYWITELPVSFGVGNIFYPSDALQTITGNSAIVLSPKDTTIDELAKKFDEGYAIVASTPFKVDAGNPLFDRTKPDFLHPSHEYFITAVNTGNNTVDVRNPHGWSDIQGNNLYLQMDYADFQDGFQTITMASTSQP